MSSIEAIIERQLRRWEMERSRREEEERNGRKAVILPVVTVSRQRGSGGTILAERLATRLGYQLLHREVIDEICNSSGYRRQVVESLDDRVRSKVELWFEGLLKGLLVNSSDYLRHLCRVIRSISEHGGVIVVGRGANFILSSDRTFSIRVVASIARRVENLREREGMVGEEAEKKIREADRARADFIRSHFKREIDDPTAYDLVINLTHFDLEAAVALAEAGIRSRWQKLGL